MFDESNDKKRKQIDKEVDNAARLLGASVDYDEDNTARNFNSSDFGICCDCVNLRAAMTMYGKKIARCFEFDKVLNLNSKDVIVECTEYKRRGSMSLFDMKEIAYIIEVDKRKVGF